MSQEIYLLLQNIIPELTKKEVPLDVDFDTFYDWINELNEFVHYIEFKEYYDNGIANNFYFKKFNVDTDLLQNEIEAQIAEVIEQLYDDEDAQANALEQIEELIFDKILEKAKLHQLSLLVVYRENPYWMLVPTQSKEQLDQIVKAFNQAFNDDGDLNMVVYSES